MRFPVEDPTPLIEMFRVAADVLGEGTLEIAEPELTIQGMDGAQVTYIKSRIFSTFFVDPQFTRRSSSAYDFESVHRLLRAASRGSMGVTLEVGDDDTLIITAEGDDVTRRLTENAMTYEYVAKKPPLIEYDDYADIPLQDFLTTLKESSIHGADKVFLEMTPDELIISSRSNEGNYEAVFSHDCSVEGTHRACYTTSLIQRALPRISDTLSLGFQDDRILHMRIEGAGLDHEAYIAPRIID